MFTSALSFARTSSASAINFYRKATNFFQKTIDFARASAQNTLAIVFAFAMMPAIVACMYVIGTQEWAVWASLFAGCGMACIPGSVGLAIERGWDWRRKMGLAASVVPAAMVAALYFSGLAPAPQGKPWAAERLSPPLRSARAETAMSGQRRALPALFEPYRLSRKHLLSVKRKRKGHR